MIAGGFLLLTSLLVGMPEPAPCPREVVEPERTFTGVYVDAFEGQAFHEGASSLADIGSRRGPAPWMSVDLVALASPFGVTRRQPSYAYRVKFRGVRRSRPPYRFPCGYGHMSASGSEVAVSKLLAIEPLGSSINFGNRR